MLFWLYGFQLHHLFLPGGLRHVREFLTVVSDSCSRQVFGSAAAVAGKRKKTVASRLQERPIAQAVPSPASVGLLASPNEPKPTIAVMPARMTGFTTPATSCSSSRAFCQTRRT